MKIRRLITLLIAAICGLLIVGFIIPTELDPPKTMRVILEHNEEAFIVPACFEASNPSNFLEESTLEYAEEINYPPLTQCTEDALKSETTNLVASWLKRLGILNTKWDE